MKWLNKLLAKKGLALVCVQTVSEQEQVRLKEQADEARRQIAHWSKVLDASLKELAPVSSKKVWSLNKEQIRKLEQWNKKYRQIKIHLNNAIEQNQAPVIIERALMSMSEHLMQALEYCPALVHHTHFNDEKVNHHMHEMSEVLSNSHMLMFYTLDKFPISPKSLELYLQAVVHCCAHFKSVSPERLLKYLTRVDEKKAHQKMWVDKMWDLMQYIDLQEVKMPVLLEWFEKSSVCISRLDRSDYKTVFNEHQRVFDAIMQGYIVPHSVMQPSDWEHAKNQVIEQLVYAAFMARSEQVQERQEIARKLWDHAQSLCGEKTLKAFWHTSVLTCFEFIEKTGGFQNDQEHGRWISEKIEQCVAEFQKQSLEVHIGASSSSGRKSAPPLQL